MATCDICGKEFKNKSGLSGHKQLAHSLEQSAPALQSTALERSTNRSDGRLEPSDKAVKESDSERSAGASEEEFDQFLEQLFEGQDGLLERSPARVLEEHVHGWTCHQCHTFAEEAYENGRQAGIAEVGDVPGVSEAVTFNREAEERNESHLSIPVKQLEQEFLHVTKTSGRLFTVENSNRSITG